MLGSDSFLGLSFSDFVCLGGYESYEFDGAVDQQVSRILSEGEPWSGRKDFADDLLHGSFSVPMS